MSSPLYYLREAWQILGETTLGIWYENVGESLMMSMRYSREISQVWKLADIQS
jgi:hypothetical protein